LVQSNEESLTKDQSEIKQLEDDIILESNEVKDLTIKLSKATQSLSDH